MIIPSTVRALMLFRRAEIRRNLILSKLDYERDHDQMETQILVVLGGGSGARKKPRYGAKTEAAPSSQEDQWHMTEEDKQGQPG